LQVRVRILDPVRHNPDGAADADARLIMGHAPHEVAAVAMPDFMVTVALQADRPSRPKDEFKRHVTTLSDVAAREVKSASVFGRKER
jgi:hypothetical protein